MKQTINLSQFRDAFKAIRPDNFSYEGLEILFNGLEEFEDDTGEEMELDVIAICCDFYEMKYKDIFNTYAISTESEEPTDEEIEKAVTDYLEQNTWVLGKTDTGNYVFRQF
jgi:hypothetical protein